MGSSTKTIRYDGTNEQFMMKNINNDPDGRVWLYKQAESYQVNTQCLPEGTGTITLLNGVVDNKSQEGETVTLAVEPISGYAIESVTVKNLTTEEETTLLSNRGTELQFVMPASDVLVTANFYEMEVTGVEGLGNAAQVTAVEYFNLIGMNSSKPFNGVNIVRTTYSDGTVVVSKIVK